MGVTRARWEQSLIRLLLQHRPRVALADRSVDLCVYSLLYYAMLLSLGGGMHTYMLPMAFPRPVTAVPPFLSFSSFLLQDHSL